MKRKRLFLCLFLGIVSSVLFAEGTREMAPKGLGTVKVDGGLVSGMATETEGVTLYRGVPYAAPPVGALRWKTPADVIPWDGVKECTLWPNMSLQDKSGNKPHVSFYGDEFYYSDKNDPPASEDCLYLNIYTPANDGNVASLKLPVYYYIHGGGNNHGYNSKVEFNASELSKLGIVVVEVQYRLGALGFLALPELTAESGTSGNYAILDLVKGLEWVQKNVKAFGGDPDNVTIGGQSAGGMDTRVLLSTPSADGLYKRAIMQSSFGYAVCPIKGNSLQVAESLGSAAMKKLFGDDITLEKLRAMSEEELSKPEIINKFLNSSTSITIDDHVISARRAADLSPVIDHISIMIGNNSDEMTSLSGDWKKSYDKAGYKAGLEKYFGATLSAKYDLLSIFPYTDGTQANRTLLSLTCDDLLMTNRQNSLSTGSNNYVYFFSQNLPKHTAEYASGRNEDFYGAFHSAELWYMFGSMRDVKEQRQWTEGDHALSDVMSAYWANFIRTGNPNGQGLPYWPVCSESTEGAYMHFGDDTAKAATSFDNPAKEKLYRERHSL